MNWTTQPPKTPGLYLYRIDGAAGLMDVHCYKDLQMGISEGLYARLASPFAISAVPMKPVLEMRGEWCDVTTFCESA